MVGRASYTRQEGSTGGLAGTSTISMTIVVYTGPPTFSGCNDLMSSLTEFQALTAHPGRPSH
ncbi:hypothetical protein D7D52_22070 [Nocardia yunnanensis]|uniref:Uncharacterized protein n=1 Tax=Nocardia yunnanensis TaxID=2382165 RepID=A0A386ZEY7_9NOCA|nr:hypothetical protein D7D52_22070 [Nocardia yunnanensis]